MMFLRLLILPLLAVTLFSACSDSSKTSKNAFWPWFDSRKSEFAELFSYDSATAARSDSKLQQRLEDTVTEVGAKLREIHPEFAPFFGASEKGNEMIVTVHGQATYFDAVDQFITSAPKIEGWTFTALKQPVKFSPDTEIQSGSARLKAGEWRYTKSKNKEGSFDFVIYVPAKVSDDQEGFRQLFTNLTMDALGERLAASAMGSMEVRELTENSNQTLSPFTSIHADVSQGMQ
ncbi:MAG: hypothetical protein JWM59_3678 [Verrucomicrobiales bacterium]|nr:hypothetical protein [Verrucomicrobiales bacterium]